jgi:Secretion system C-terminal sorting domain
MIPLTIIVHSKSKTMKKSILIFLSIFFCSIAFGQRKMKPNQPKAKAYKITHPNEETYINGAGAMMQTKSMGATNTYGTQVGTTYYDYQTNGSMPERVQVDPNGNITAIWIKGQMVNPNGGDRRIGYNYYDATTAAWIGEDTIGGAGMGANSRRGWPFLMTEEGPEDILGSHTPQGRHYRPAAGTGTWQNDLLIDLSDSVNTTSPYQSGWGGAATATGDTVHHIAAAYASDGLLAFKYSRSPDNTQTWDIQDLQLPGMDSAIWGNNIGHNVYDAFAIDARGSKVSIVSGGWDQDVHFWNSTDRGDSWTHNLIFDFDTLFAFRDVDGSHQHISGDEGFACAIDASGIAHIATGMVGILSDPGMLGGSGTFFPFQSGIIYWNESMGFDNYLDDTLTNAQFIIVDYVDEDGNGINSTPASFDSIGRYFNHGVLSFPAFSMSDNGAVVLTWSGTREDTKNLGITLQQSDDGFLKYHRDIYSWASCDGGSTWIIDSIKNVADDIDGAGGGIGTPTEEDVFVQAFNRIGADNMVHILFQTDEKADRSFDGTPNENFMIHFSYPLSTVGCVTGLKSKIEENLSWSIFPNPADNQFTIALDLKKGATYTIELKDLLGRTFQQNQHKFNRGSQMAKLDVSNLSPGLYLVNINSGSESVSKKVIIE